MVDERPRRFLKESVTISIEDSWTVLGLVSSDNRGL